MTIRGQICGSYFAVLACALTGGLNVRFRARTNHDPAGSATLARALTLTEAPAATP